MIAIISGWLIGRFKLEHWIEDWVQALRAGEAVVIEEKLIWTDRIDRGREAVRDVVGKVWIYVVAGIGVGAAFMAMYLRPLWPPSWARMPDGQCLPLL